MLLLFVELMDFNASTFRNDEDSNFMFRHVYLTFGIGFMGMTDVCRRRQQLWVG